MLAENNPTAWHELQKMVARIVAEEALREIRAARSSGSQENVEDVRECEH